MQGFLLPSCLAFISLNIKYTTKLLQGDFYIKMNCY